METRDVPRQMVNCEPNDSSEPSYLTSLLRLSSNAFAAFVFDCIRQQCHLKPIETILQTDGLDASLVANPMSTMCSHATRQYHISVVLSRRPTL